MKKQFLKNLLAVLILFASGLFAKEPMQLFPLQDVRLNASPFLDAQTTDVQYLLALNPDKLLAPFQREAGLPLKSESYGNWESSGLDGHMGGHYISALALGYASTSNPELLKRLNYVVSELKKCQQKNGNGYIGGIPGGKEVFEQIAKGNLQADNFSVNGKWVPWYNLHKTFAGLRDAYRYAGNQDAKKMLVEFSEWAIVLSSHLDDQQMQQMLRSEHGGMNEVLADVAEITGDKKYLAAAIRFSHQSVLQPLEKNQDKLTGLHANTQIPKVIGFKRVGDLSNNKSWQDAAEFFWKTVVDHRTVAIGGNSVKEHFHDQHDFSSMIAETEGPETCNTYNMLKLTELLFLTDAKVRYVDYYERALFNHILSSQRPDTGGFVYFTPMRPNHYRVYSQVDKAMWCCVSSGIENHVKYGQFIYAHQGNNLYVNLFIPSELNWQDKKIRISQINSFPDQEGTTIIIRNSKKFTLHIRYPQWVADGKLELRVNNKVEKISAKPGSYIKVDRYWKKGDRIDLSLPMTTYLEQMPDASNYYALLYGPIVLAAKTAPFSDEKLNFLADDSRMGHIAQGPLCPLEAAPLFVSDTTDFMSNIKPVPGKSMTFKADTVLQGKNAGQIEFIPFFRLHDSRYMIYWNYSTPDNLKVMQEQLAKKEAEQLALDAKTIDQISPGEQQPESDHFYKAEGGDSGLNKGMRWRHATSWLSYELTDKNREAKYLRVSYSRLDAGRKFDIFLNNILIESVELKADYPQEIYFIDYPVPAAVHKTQNGKILVKFVAHKGSIAGGLYDLRLLR
jgi:uncharacterized protein